MTVTFVNLFEVPPGAEADFYARWEVVNDYMRRKDGYVDHTLHRSLAPDARFRFVNVALWSSPEAWRAAHDEGFRALVAAPEWSAYPSTPALFEVVHAGSC